MEACPPDSASRPWEQCSPSSEAVEMEGLHLLSACSVGLSWLSFWSRISKVTAASQAPGA